MNPKLIADLQGVTALTAWDLMTRPVISLRDDCSVREAARVLLENNIQGAPVVNEYGKLIGVLSVTDLARHARDHATDVVRESDYYHLMEEARISDISWEKGFHIEGGDETVVRDIMTPSVIAVSENAPLLEIVKTLIKHRIHRVVVTRAERRTVVGVVSETDVVRALLPLLSKAAQTDIRESA